MGAAAGDLVVAGTGIDVFDGDEPVFAIAGVLPAGGIEIDAVGARGELSGVTSTTTVDGVVAEESVDPVLASSPFNMIVF